MLKIYNPTNFILGTNTKSTKL